MAHDVPLPCAGELMKTQNIVALLALAIAPLAVASSKEPVARMNETAEVFQEVMATPDRAIPQELLEKAHCIVIVPGVKKAAFIVGGKYGKGYLFCRKASGGG